MNRIDALFARLRSEGRKALMPFVTAGDPDLATTSALIPEMVRRGADMIEVGLPYSDPIADGPVIAASYHRALTRGVDLDGIFEAIRALRAADQGTPMVAMVSFSIIHRRGVERFLGDVVGSDFDGMIVPDLPIEESASLCRLAGEAGLKLIQLITPTTPRDRALAIARTTTGFIYYVSVAGITGERRSLPPELASNVAWLRSQTDLPICIGFGIGTPGQIRDLAPAADGLIVGSALVRRLEGAAGRPREEIVREIGQFIADLAEGLRP